MSKKTFSILLSGILLVNLTSLFLDIFIVDSSLYATISKSFVKSGDYFNIFVDGKDWLDKPHFPFWLNALSMEIFGINSFAYKLPSFLFFVLGLYYTFLISDLLYNKQVAYFSTLILGSSIHIFLSNNDVRAEAILLGLIMGTSYYFLKLKDSSSLKYIFLAAAFASASIMTKGFFVLIIPFSALFFDSLINKNLNQLLKLRWLVVLFLILFFISPEIYALYCQFDAHPEKVVFGEQNVSGIKFFFWDSQFGRFFNTGPIKGRGDLFFYFHTILWAFAPWAIIGFAALYTMFKKILKLDKSTETFSFFGFTILFIVFSVSKFQLPHYSNILFPFLAIMTANLIVQNSSIWVSKTLQYSINLYLIIFVLVIFVIAYFFRPSPLYPGFVLAFILLALLIIANQKNTRLKHKFFLLGVVSSSIFFLYLNLSFYPNLLKYQGGSQLAYFLNKNYPNTSLKVAKDDWLLQFYYDGEIQKIDAISKTEKSLVFADEKFLDKIKKSGINFKVIRSFGNFRVTKMTKDFFYFKTRNQNLETYYLIELN